MPPLGQPGGKLCPMPDTEDDTEDDTEQVPAAPTQTLLDHRWFRRGLIATLLVIALIVGTYACNNDTSGNNSVSQSKPFPFVERLVPASGAEVLQQSEVGIDLAIGYDAYLIINGTEIRDVRTTANGDGLQKTLSVGRVSYTPGEGKRVERLLPERNQVTAMVWRQLDGPSTAKAVYWTFNAS